MIKYLIVLLFMIKNSMAYEESSYKIMQQGDNFEVRFYEERIVIQTRFQGSNSGFQKLFKYTAHVLNPTDGSVEFILATRAH